MEIREPYDESMQSPASILPESKSAFKGDIVEHDPLAVLPQRGNGSGQKVSKFKAQRDNR